MQSVLSCQNLINSFHKIKPTNLIIFFPRRSNQDIGLEERIMILIFHLEFIFNRITTINLIFFILTLDGWVWGGGSEGGGGGRGGTGVLQSEKKLKKNCNCD